MVLLKFKKSCGHVNFASDSSFPILTSSFIFDHPCRSELLLSYSIRISYNCRKFCLLAAMSIIHDLQRMQCHPSTFHKKTSPSEDLQKIASDKGFSICHNPGSGNCMFHALSEQLQSVKGIQISQRELRKKLVECLGNSPELVSQWFTDGLRCD